MRALFLNEMRSYPPVGETNPPKKKGKEPKVTSFLHDFLNFAQQLVGTLMVFFILQTYVVATAVVSGESMEPTLTDGQYLIVNKFSELERFDVITFEPPNKPDVFYVKRIIGVPGDTVEYQHNQLILNGTPIEEEYIDYNDYDLFEDHYTLQELFDTNVVPEGHYFVVGDNRDNSMDSRSFGFISEESIVGKVGKAFDLPAPIANLLGVERQLEMEPEN